MKPKLTLTKFVMIIVLPDDWTTPDGLLQILIEQNYDAEELHPHMLQGYLEELVAEGWIEANYEQTHKDVFLYRSKQLSGKM